jgi:hypothetical protein
MRRKRRERIGLRFMRSAAGGRVEGEEESISFLKKRNKKLFYV